jgi:hypothetical protein
MLDWRLFSCKGNFCFRPYFYRPPIRDQLTATHLPSQQRRCKRKQESLSIVLVLANLDVAGATFSIISTDFKSAYKFCGFLISVRKKKFFEPYNANLQGKAYSGEKLFNKHF